MAKRKQSKKLSRRERLDRWLTRNTYLYKWGKILWKSKWGRRGLALLLLVLLSFWGVRRLESDSVKRFVRQWQEYENRGDFKSFASCLDLSAENPDRALFPDWEGEFFNTRLQLMLQKLTVKRMPQGVFQVKALVVMMNAGTEEDRFQGIIHVRRRRGWKIIRVEIQ